MHSLLYDCLFSSSLIFVEITNCTPNTVSTAVIGIHFTFCFSDDLLTPAFTPTTTPEKMKARTGNLGPEEALEAFQEGKVQKNKAKERVFVSRLQGSEELKRDIPGLYKDPRKNLKGHSQLCDCVDLDASFSHFEKSLPQSEIKVHAEIRFIFRSICLIFNRLLKNLFLSVLLLIL